MDRILAIRYKFNYLTAEIAEGAEEDSGLPQKGTRNTKGPISTRVSPYFLCARRALCGEHVFSQRNLDSEA